CIPPLRISPASLGRRRAPRKPRGEENGSLPSRKWCAEDCSGGTLSPPWYYTGRVHPQRWGAPAAAGMRTRRATEQISAVCGAFLWKMFSEIHGGSRKILNSNATKTLRKRRYGVC
ncbi:unnamed protein product, partial [Ectocarpus fasciculatus]